MNISKTQTNFQGKREVMYSLKKAAECSRAVNKEYLLSSGPKPLSRRESISHYSAKMDAYLDSATYDTEFYSTLKEIKDDSISFFEKTLAPIKNEFSSRKPFDLFKSKIRDAVEKSTIQNYRSSYVLKIS